MQLSRLNDAIAAIKSELESKEEDTIEYQRRVARSRELNLEKTKLISKLSLLDSMDKGGHSVSYSVIIFLLSSRSLTQHVMRLKEELLTKPQ
jgi:hypothetical protein